MGVFWAIAEKATFRRHCEVRSREEYECRSRDGCGRNSLSERNADRLGDGVEFSVERRQPATDQ